MRMHFQNRREAGRLLAHRLSAQGQRFDLVVALPRGGVDVAFPIAREFDIPLDILIVKKLGAPGQPELAIGAIASGGYAYINYEVCRMLGISQREVVAIRFAATKELLEREKKLLKGHISTPLRGKSVLIIDDGIATGATMEVAISAINAQQPRSITVAVPVAALSATERLHRRIDHVFALYTPSILGSVGEFYQEFPQVSEEEVKEMIEEIDQRVRSRDDLATQR
jgi:putative phosphoribosyl transferase